MQITINYGNASLLGPYGWGNTLQEYYCLVLDAQINSRATAHIGEYLAKRRRKNRPK